MPKYEIDFSYNQKMWGQVNLDANNEEDAIELAKEYFEEEYVVIEGEEVTDFLVEAYREI